MNIQSLPWLKFCHDHYLVSEFRGKASIIAKAAFFELLCFAMKQTPALSIPNDDRVLAGWTGISLKQWQKIKDLVLSQFTLNPTNNRYYSPMLVELYNNNEHHQQTERKPSSSAERMAKKRERDALKASQQTASDTNVLPTSVTCNNDVTDHSVTLGDKGGDLELKLENLEQEVVVNADVLTKQRAQKPLTTTKFCMPFDFGIQPNELEPFMLKLDVPMTKHSSSTLGHFVSYYLTKSYHNTRDEWVYQYALWLKREKDKPVDNSSPPPTKLAAAYIQPVKPLWETMAEQQAQRQAASVRNPQQLAAAKQALAQVRKKLGLKAA